MTLIMDQCVISGPQMASEFQFGTSNQTLDLQFTTSIVYDSNFVYLPPQSDLMDKADWKSQIRLSCGFCSAEFWSSLAYEAGEHKPQHCLTRDFISDLLMALPQVNSVTNLIAHCRRRARRPSTECGTRSGRSWPRACWAAWTPSTCRPAARYSTSARRQAPASRTSRTLSAR